jgi:hypothetical protein
MLYSPSGYTAAVSLGIFLLQEIPDEPLQETANETDDQHHLPSQSARFKIGVSDLEARDGTGRRIATAEHRQR